MKWNRAVKGPILGYLALAWSVVLLPAVGQAQSLAGGAIAGVVRDASGGVLPGVTVEAASPALIEKVRSVVTDGRGVYRIVDLRPGVYSVTFTLPGFSAFRREGIELTTGFTATVNGEMTVGALSETITVSGAAPIVDTQNVSPQVVFRRELSEALPSSRTVNQFVTLIPAAVYGAGGASSQDVGGNKGENVQGFRMHGGRTNDFQQLREGMFFGTLVAAGNRMTSVNPASIEETVIQAGGGTAEAESGGALVNIIPRDGGNAYRGSFSGEFSDKNLEADNLDDALRARGLSKGFSIRKRYDVGGGVGGPLKQDRLWFFGTWRKFTQSEYAPGNYFNATPDTLFYTPDLNRPAYTLNYGRDLSLRMTVRPSEKDRISGFVTNERNCNCFSISDGITSPEGRTNAFYWPNWKGQLSWNRPHTTRLLFEAGVTVVDGVHNQRHAASDWEKPAHLGGVFAYRSVQDSARNYLYGAPVSWNRTDFGQINERFVVSYVTGSHSFKTGIQFRSGGRINQQTHGADGDMISYTFLGRVPQSVTYYAGPLGDRSTQNAFALYTQDQWTIRRLTLNVGVRYDQLNGYIPAQQLAAGPFVPARAFAEVKDSPNWKDLSPRLGVAYDLFGTGSTAVKAYLGRYVNFEGIGGITTLTTPANLIVTSATRIWNDNGDYIPQESELGPLSSSAFGQVRQTTTYADDVLHGFGVRGYNWQGSVQLQHELRRGLGLSVGYFRTSYGNFQVTDNLAVTPADHTPFCITAPTHASLPEGGGTQICGLADLNPAQFGLTQNLVAQASNYGKQRDIFNGIDVTMSAQFGQGGVLQGGLSTGSQMTDRCFVVDSPQELHHCKSSPPWSAGTQVKFLAVYPLPWDLQMAGTFQNNPPIPTTASFVASNAAIAPSLGRNLSSCGTRVPCNATAVINLINPVEFYQEPRIQQIDLRFSRIFRRGTMRVQPEFDVYNLLNANPVLAMVTRFGSAWRNATTVLSPRVLKLGVKVEF